MFASQTVFECCVDLGIGTEVVQGDIFVDVLFYFTFINFQKNYTFPGYFWGCPKASCTVDRQVRWIVMKWTQANWP